MMAADSSASTRSALSLLRSRLSVDMDQLSPELAERYGPFCDMTSNPAALAVLIASDTQVDVVRREVARARLEARSGLDEAVEWALDLLVVALSKAILPHITGRVHAQVSPRHALSTRATLDHAHRLVRLFAQEGISPGRVCLQIPCTGAGMAAAAQLEKSGVRTAATAVFTVDQARAAVQAGCLYVVPYWHEMSAHLLPAEDAAYDAPARDYSTVAVIREILSVCEWQEGEPRPRVMVMNAGTPADALAISTLGVQHLSLSGSVIEELACGSNEAISSRASDDSVEAGTRTSAESFSEVEMCSPREAEAESVLIDWLAEEGVALDNSIRNDGNASRQLETAMRSFEDCEARVALVLRQLML